MRRICLSALLVLFACPAFADDDQPLDVVTLYNGRKVEGRVIECTDDRIVLVRRSKDGGTSRFTLKPDDVRRVEYGRGGDETRPTSSSDKLRDAWFLLRSEGRIVGTRQLEMWSLSGNETPGFRIEENVRFFAQGRHVPEVHVRLVEETDLRFVLVKGLYREVGEASALPDGPQRYVRSVAGHVEDGVFQGGVTAGGESSESEVAMAVGTRGRLGLREHLLRRDRAVGIDEATIFDVASASQVIVRAGFVSVGRRTLRTPGPGEPMAVRRDEFHWEEGGTRLISFFDETTHPIEEALSEATMVVPATKERAEAAAENAAARARDPKKGVVKLPEGGIQFTLPDPSWTWRAQTATPTHTGWRVLGRARAPVYAADVRVELHPEGARATPGVTSARAWLVERLRGVASDLQVFADVEPLEDIRDAWRIGVRGTLKGDTQVRTVAVVIDRGDDRVVLLIACPDASWKAGQPAVERFIASLELL